MLSHYKDYYMIYVSKCNYCQGICMAAISIYKPSFLKFGTLIYNHKNHVLAKFYK